MVRSLSLHSVSSFEEPSAQTKQPLLYALAMDRGFLKANTVLDDLVTVGGIENSDRQFLGPLLPRQALANSRNIPAVNVLKQVGLDGAYQFFRELGLHDNRLPADHYGLGLAIGGMPTSLERLVKVYAMLANSGVQQDLRWFSDQELGAPKRSLTEATSRQVSLFLADPMARLPTFSRMGATEYPFPVAVKTGTSQGFRDAWTMAYSKEYLVGVWVGRADWSPMKGLTGGNSAAKLVREVLLDLHEGQGSGLADLSFPPPVGYEAVDVCGYTGQMAVQECFQKVREWFPPDELPERDTTHLRLPIDQRSGLLATSETIEEFREYRTFVRLPGAYAGWAAANNLAAPPGEYSSVEWLENTESSSLSIMSPEHGVRLLINPDIPAGLNSLGLSVSVDPPVEQILWFVDGRPYELVDSPYAARWPLARGRHSFQARLPYRSEVSEVVEVFVE